MTEIWLKTYQNFSYLFHRFHSRFCQRQFVLYLTRWNKMLLTIFYGSYCFLAAQFALLLTTFGLLVIHWLVFACYNTDADVVILSLSPYLSQWWSNFGFISYPLDCCRLFEPLERWNWFHKLTANLTVTCVLSSMSKRFRDRL